MADPEPAIRRRIVDAVGAGGGIEVVAEAADGGQALRLHAELAPDVVLLSADLPRRDGAEVTRRIAAAAPATCVIVLTEGDDPSVTECVHAGARGVLRKDRGGLQTAAIVLRLLSIRFPPDA